MRTACEVNVKRTMSSPKQVPLTEMRPSLEAMPRSVEHGSQVCLRKHLYAPTPRALRAMLPQPQTIVARE